jgi:hypothetical protein
MHNSTAAGRINRLVVEAGLGLLPFNEKTVTTPTGHAYVGVDLARKLCGVSIMRSGEQRASVHVNSCILFWWHMCAVVLDWEMQSYQISSRCKCW